MLHSDAAALPPLPSVPPGLVGRERDLMSLRRMVADRARLITLVGPAGAGKTRLALSFAGSLAPAVVDDVGYVGLDTLHDPAALPPVLAAAFGIHDPGRSSSTETLERALLGRRVLLVLDNFEQILSAGPDVAELLVDCPDLTVLVTSRAPLRVYEEREYPVQPLDLPPEGAARAGDLASYAAVQLFVTRARSVRPEFELTDSNASAVAALCHQVDGLPLAIELAAARVKLLPPAAIVQRLGARQSGSLSLLTGGGRDQPARRQSVRGALSWSFELLTPPARALLRRLAVFTGGWTLESAEAVCSDELVPVDRVLDLLTDLVDQSLVVVGSDSDGTRFRLLETIREFGAEQLELTGEAEVLQRRRLAYLVALTQAAAPELIGPEQTSWLNRLENEHDNIRDALRWAVDGHDAESALRIVGALTRFWEPHGHLSAGQDWARRALAVDPVAPAALRARALLCLGVLASRQTAYAVARPALEAAEPLMRAVDDQAGLATTLNVLGNVRRNLGDLRIARTLYAESLTIHRRLGGQRDIAIVLNNLAVAAWAEGDLPAAQELLEETLTMQRLREDVIGTAMALVNLGVVAKERNDLTSAEVYLAESLPLFRQSGDRFGVCMTLREQGMLAIVQGDLLRARPVIEESLELGRDLDDPRSITSALQGLGIIAQQLGELEMAQHHFASALAISRDANLMRSCLEALDAIALLDAERGLGLRAARLWGGIGALRERSGIGRLPADQRNHDLAVVQVSAGLGAAHFADALAEGRRLDLDAAARLATSVASLDREVRSESSSQTKQQLTPREREVLALLAAGRSNREIAERLVISPATVHQHLINIYAKLDVHSRAQATAYAFQHGLTQTASTERRSRPSRRPSPHRTRDTAP